MKNNLKSFKYGIVLSGGGARGIAHIGVLDALEKKGIKLEIISGTSMGALVGVFYAAGFTPAEILDIVSERKFHEILNWQLPFSGLVNIDQVMEIMTDKIRNDSFSALEIPFYCAVANLNSGKLEMKSEGKLFQWVLASISIPVIFEPQEIDGQTYVDGGLLNNLPVQAIREKCETVIGINVNHNGTLKEVEGMKSIAERCFRLGIEQNIAESKKQCDILMEPPETRRYSTFAFNDAQEIYQLGFEYADKCITEELKKV